MVDEVEPTEAEYTAAQEALDAAVLKFFESTGWNDSGVLTDWMMVGHQLSFCDAGGTHSVYPLVFSRGGIPQHVAKGLLDCAADSLRDGLVRHDRD